MQDKSEAPPYEEMALYYPQPNQKRPLILVGPPSIGRHELRQRLLDDTSKFAAPIPRKPFNLVIDHLQKVIRYFYFFSIRHLPDARKW